MQFHKTTENKANKINLPKKLLIGTGNHGKFVEISKLLLDKFNIELISTREFDLEEPEENGSTFIENSLIKARFYGKQTNLPTLTDDSGLCIQALNNKPGIHSARYAIDPSTSKANFPMAFDKIAAELKQKEINANKEIVLAKFVCALSFFNPVDKSEVSMEGIVNGRIQLPARGKNGFGYDPIFIKNGMEKTFGEIDQEFKDSISHRSQAFEKLISCFRND